MEEERIEPPPYIYIENIETILPFLILIYPLLPEALGFAALDCNANLIVLYYCLKAQAAEGGGHSCMRVPVRSDGSRQRVWGEVLECLD